MTALEAFACRVRWVSPLLRGLVALLAFLLVGLPAASRAEDLVSPDAWLAMQSPPKFRAGHSLPLLTRYGWELPFELRVLLAENWGFALEFGGYAGRWAVKRALTNPKSAEYRALRLAVEEPQRYKLSLILPRDMPKDADAWIGGGWSPAASDHDLDLLAKERTEPIAPLVAIVKPAIILNGGEYGIGVLGQALKYYEKDPTVQQARGREAWFDYISKMKAREQKWICDAVIAEIGQPVIYVYYTAGGGIHRDRDNDWQDWSYDYKYMKGTGTYPSDEYYYKHFNQGWQRGYFRPFWAKGDLLTQALNAKGREIAAGEPFSYDWVSGGWVEEKPGNKGNARGDVNVAAVVDETAGSLSQLDLYTGFLKCIYMAGTLGANGGYYAYPKGGFGKTFPEQHPPDWLLQLVALSRVHGLYSYLEPFVRNSALLPGPNRHAWGQFPAYELPTGQTDLRVVGRKHQRYDAWLLVAWSATGTVQKGQVEIPGRGVVEVTGDGSGKIYLAQGNGENPLEEINEGSVEKIAQTYPNLFAPARGGGLE